jgi:hypothetical protein
LVSAEESVGAGADRAERDPSLPTWRVEFTRTKTRLILQLVLSPMDMDRLILPPPGTPDTGGAARHPAP